MDLKKISQELQKKIDACNTTDDLKALAGSEGLELGDDVLEAIAGGLVVSSLDLAESSGILRLADKQGLADKLARLADKSNLAID